MAKRKTQTKPTMPSLQQVEAAHRWAQVRSALDKIHGGGKPTVREMQLYRAWHNELCEGAVSEAFRAVPLKTYQGWCEISAFTSNRHGDKYGIPCKGDKVSVPAIVNAFHNLLVDRQSSLDAVEAEAEVVDTALQRKRMAEADMAEDERDRRRGHLLPTSQVHAAHVHWANRLRKASEQLGRKFGRMAQRILDDALADCEKHVVGMFEEPPE